LLSHPDTVTASQVVSTLLSASHDLKAVFHYITQVPLSICFIVYLPFNVKLMQQYAFPIEYLSRLGALFISSQQVEL